MKKFILYEGVKKSGKSHCIDQEYQRLKNSCKDVEIINKDDFDTVIYVLENSKHEIIILNSGSDTFNIIRNFKSIMDKYKDRVAEVYTAIRPKSANSRLHAKMWEALSFDKHLDSMNVVNLP